MIRSFLQGSNPTGFGGNSQTLIIPMLWAPTEGEQHNDIVIKSLNNQKLYGNS